MRPRTSDKDYFVPNRLPFYEPVSQRQRKCANGKAVCSGSVENWRKGILNWIEREKEKCRVQSSCDINHTLWLLQLPLNVSLN